MKLSGVAPRGVDGALKVMEASAARVLPDGSRVDYTGESRQLRQEGGRFLPAMGLALLLIFPPVRARGAVQLVPRIRSSSSQGPCRSRCSGAMIFTFLKFAGPPGMHFRS